MSNAPNVDKKDILIADIEQERTRLNEAINNEDWGAAAPIAVDVKNLSKRLFELEEEE